MHLFLVLNLIKSTETFVTVYSGGSMLSSLHFWYLVPVIYTEYTPANICLLKIRTKEWSGELQKRQILYGNNANMSCWKTLGILN